MKFDNDKLKSNIMLATYTVLLGYFLLNLDRVIGALGIGFGIISPFIVAIAMAFILNIPMKFIEDKFLSSFEKDKPLRGKRAISITLTFVIIIGLITGLIIFVIPQLGESINTLSKAIPSTVDSIKIMIENNMSSFDFLNDILPEVTNMWQEVLTVVGQITGSLLDGILDATIGITSGIVNFFLALVFSIYMLIGKETLMTQGRKLVYAFTNKKIADKAMEVAAIANLKFSKFIAGQCIEAVIIGLMCFIAMTIFKMPYALLISTLVGVTAIIPIFGALIGTIPGVFIIFMIDPMKAVWFVVLIIVVQQLEGNIIYPKVVGSSIGLSGIWVMLAVLVGGSTYGVTGILVGIPLLAVCYTVLSKVTNKRLDEKGIKESEISRVADEIEKEIEC